MNTNEDIYECRLAAEGGDAEAQYQLGLKFVNGQGVEKDEAEAVRWYRKAAEQGHSTCQYFLGWYLANGRGVEKNEAEAVTWYRKAATQNVLGAQFDLGVMYANGRGVTKDAVEAAKWARKAAEQGHAEGQYYLGWYLARGQGVNKDEVAAVTWYRKAAEQGNAGAQCEMGIMCADGRGTGKDAAEAAMWFRKAAAQGNKKAQELLSNLPQAAQTIQAPAAKPRAASREAKAAAPECKPLLDASTPRVYVQNAFRITGLAVDAQTRDIKRRIDDLKHAEENGEAEDEHNHAFAIVPPPSIEHIREAAQRLHDPERRLIEEFFWFWPSEWGKGNSDPSLLAMKNGDKDTAFKNWLACISDDAKSGVVSRNGGIVIRDQSALASPREIAVAKHNLAVMYQLVALDSEHHVLENEFTAAQLETIEQYWRKCFKWWEELTEDETFWSLITERIRMYNEPERLKTGFARQMRASLPEAMDKINAMLAISYSERGKLALAENHIRYMKETHQGQDDIEKTLAMVTQPLKARVISYVEKATGVADRQPQQAAKSARELLQAVAEPMKIIQQILSPEDHVRIDLFDSVAEACLTCQLAYARETKDWSASLAIIEDGAKYAVSSETKKRLAENIAKVTRNKLFGQYIEPLAELIEKSRARSSTAAKVRSVEENLLPYLKKIESAKGVSIDVYNECADLVALFVRGVSISAYNEDNDLAGSINILNIALNTARGREAREQLQKDKDQLKGFEAESTKHNLRMQIRGDDIEITRDYVRYKQDKIPVSQIQGVKFGVFVQYTNGVESSSSYLIDITDGGNIRIHIECKRIFRGKSDAEQDYRRILDAIFEQIATPLVQKLAQSVVAGRPLQMGGARLTSEGVYLTTGSLWWQKEIMVPWSDIRYGNHQGSLNLSSSKDKNISTSMALRDAWNAVFFEYIAKAVVKLKG
ncbi:MAG: tetratricopeptide repeat protein [bacterium]